MDFKFCRNIHSVPAEQKSMKMFEKREGGRMQGLPNFLGVSPIISGTGKVTKFKFCTHIYWLSQNKSQLQILGKVAVGVVRDSRKFFRAPIYRAHHAVIFAIAQLFCNVFFHCFVRLVRVQVRVRVQASRSDRMSKKWNK